jgi:hypothetical protein
MPGTYLRTWLDEKSLRFRHQIIHHFFRDNHKNESCPASYLGTEKQQKWKTNESTSYGWSVGSDVTGLDPTVHHPKSKRREIQWNSGLSNISSWDSQSHQLLTVAKYDHFPLNWSRTNSTIEHRNKVHQRHFLLLNDCKGFNVFHLEIVFPRECFLVGDSRVVDVYTC